MSVRDLCQSVRLQWQAFSRLVWPEDTLQLTRVAIVGLTDELARRYTRLLERRRRIEQIRDQLARHEQRLDRKPESVSLRQTIDRHRERLAQLEAGYARQRLAFTRRKKLHKALLSGQVVVCPDLPGQDPT